MPPISLQVSLYYCNEFIKTVDCDANLPPVKNNSTTRFTVTFWNLVIIELFGEVIAIIPLFLSEAFCSIFAVALVEQELLHKAI